MKKRDMSRKGAIEPVNLIAGIILIFGGILLISNSVNLGLLIALVGTLIKAIEVVIRGGIK